uniref:Uncharacterized protein n=1 Tax=Strigamia maritima TaxID=126957 RepID=T1JI08_STRMM
MNLSSNLDTIAQIATIGAIDHLFRPSACFVEHAGAQLRRSRTADRAPINPHQRHVGVGVHGSSQSRDDCLAFGGIAFWKKKIIVLIEDLKLRKQLK